MTTASNNPPLPEIKKILKSWLEAQTSLKWEASTDTFAGHHPRMGLAIFTPLADGAVDQEVLNQAVRDAGEQLRAKGITAISQMPLSPSATQEDEWGDKPVFGSKLSLVVPSHQIHFKAKLKILESESRQSNTARDLAASYLDKFRTGGNGGPGSKGR